MTDDDSVEEDEKSLLEKIFSYTTDVTAGIPPGVKKEFNQDIQLVLHRTQRNSEAKIKAKSQEITAASDINVEMMQAVGRSMTGKIESGDTEIPPELSQLAMKQFEKKIFRDRAKLNNIFHDTARIIGEHRTWEAQEEADTVIGDEFLSVFESEAARNTSEDMREMMAKLLAEEIVHPGSFSPRTVRVFGNLDSSLGTIFQRFCSMAIVEWH